MEKGLRLSLVLGLLLCQGGRSELQTVCPYRCQCFTASQVLCADERMSALPGNMSRQVKDFIVMTSSVAYLFSHSLEESPQLTRLVFLNNALRSVHAQAFEHLTELRELEISGNPWLESLFLGTFSNQGNLTVLLLNFNRLKTVLPGLFDSLKQLEVLQMKSNIISSLPPLLFLNLNNLRVLDLSQNKLEEVKRETLCGLAKLEILKVNNNLISSLQSDTFSNVSQLTELHLEGNRLTQLADDTFSELKNLQVLNLRGNLLRSFSDKVFGSEPSDLKELNLKGNRLIELSSLSSLTSLTDLILSSNRLLNLTEDTFRNVTALENLDLSENQLTSLPTNLFRDLFRIKALHLHSNNLSTVDAKLFEDQMLIQQLYLSNNQLETLPAGLFDLFATQHTMRLHGNPWRCDCHMWYLHDWVQRSGQDIEMLDRVLCESPLFLRRRTVVSVDRDQLVCHLSKAGVPDLNACSLQASNDTVTVRCKAHRCSPVTVKVQFVEEDGTTTEHILKNDPKYSQCSNKEVLESP
ncbi:carboxypeptidase N subunit 2 [Salarias fasciatus]|uniref:Carboxypeptidase N subunit 2-like n=1 Tax=Salarias fasciatus TaxID=181472 RepID=A0A672H7C5_SALFA|nr:carboxypeptidase N subunit 2-like [Salarias fasciatus]